MPCHHTEAAFSVIDVLPQGRRVSFCWTAVPRPFAFAALPQSGTDCGQVYVWRRRFAFEETSKSSVISFRYRSSSSSSASAPGPPGTHRIFGGMGICFSITSDGLASHHLLPRPRAGQVQHALRAAGGLRDVVPYLPPPLGCRLEGGGRRIMMAIPGRTCWTRLFWLIFYFCGRVSWWCWPTGWLRSRCRIRLPSAGAGQAQLKVEHVEDGLLEGSFSIVEKPTKDFTFALKHATFCISGLLLSAASDYPQLHWIFYDNLKEKKTTNRRKRRVVWGIFFSANQEDHFSSFHLRFVFVHLLLFFI